jgi:hypothetical protein
MMTTSDGQGKGISTFSQRVRQEKEKLEGRRQDEKDRDSESGRTFFAINKHVHLRKYPAIVS